MYRKATHTKSYPAQMRRVARLRNPAIPTGFLNQVTPCQQFVNLQEYTGCLWSSTAHSPHKTLDSTELPHPFYHVRTPREICDSRKAFIRLIMPHPNLELPASRTTICHLGYSNRNTFLLFKSFPVCSINSLRPLVSPFSYLLLTG